MKQASAQSRFSSLLTASAVAAAAVPIFAVTAGAAKDGGSGPPAKRSSALVWPARELTFPAQSQGLLRFIKYERQTFDVTSSKPTLVAEKQASGRVSVPPGVFVLFRPNHRFFQDPTVLRKLPPNGLNQIDLQFFAMADEEDKQIHIALKEVTRLSGLEYLDVDRTELNDKDLAIVNSMPNLLGISTYGAPVDGSYLRSLTKLKKVQRICFGDYNINQTELQTLRNFPELLAVHLARCGVTDEGLKLLAQCPSLTSIALVNNPKVTDAGLVHMAKMPKLTYLDLRGTAITADGLNALKHTNLRELILPENIDKKKLDALKKSMPNTYMQPADSKHEKDPSAYKELLAPITRTR